MTAGEARRVVAETRSPTDAASRAVDLPHASGTPQGGAGRCCICYCVDQGYAFPTLLSAIQARANTGFEVADVIIFGLDFDEASADLFAGICSQERIGFIRIDRDLLGGLPSTFGRLFMNDYIPSFYDRVLYLDGDTQIVGALSELLSVSPGVGRIMGAADPIAFMTEGSSKSAMAIRNYLADLGFRKGEDWHYFNAGILYAQRRTWCRVTTDAVDFYRSNSNICHRLDQSALNAVTRGSHDPMSLRWNFPAFMMNCGVESAMEPIIYHFMSNPRPWHGKFPPWHGNFVRPYDDLVRKYPKVLPYRRNFKPARYVKYVLQQRYKVVAETLAWRMSARRQAILAYEATCRGLRRDYRNGQANLPP